MKDKVKSIVESKSFQNFIIVAIILNAVVLGLETVKSLNNSFLSFLALLDKVFLALFSVEILLKLYAYRLSFFKNGWNNFDFAIVAISLVPTSEAFSVLRALRILRVLRLISVVPQFRKVAQAFFDSLQGMTAIASIISIIFYVGAVMSTKLFGEQFPEWFGSIPKSLYTLFQIMTLESWSMGIVRPVMEVYPYAWLFFVPFILVTTFAAINLLIGIIVNSMQNLYEDSAEQIESHLAKQDKDRRELQRKIKDIETLLEEIKSRI